MDKIQIALVTVLVGLLVIVLTYHLQNWTPNSSGKPTFLIVGLNNSGKTALFNRILTGQFVNTVSSIEPAAKEVGLPLSNPAIQQKYQIIDYPGYLKYENLFKNLLSTIKLTGIIFVIDADVTSFNKNAGDLAVKLMKLLRLTEQDPDGVNFLFAVNKTELFNALPVTKIKKVIEQEMSKLIQSKLGEKRGETEDEDEADLDYWSQNSNFRFEAMRGNMDFIPGSVLKGNVQAWENWIDERVVN